MKCSSTGSRVASRCETRAPEPEAGFTLIEILVAFAIAALVLGVLYRVYSGGLQSSVASQRYSEAVLVAESTLEELSTGRPTDAGGDAVGIYERSWSVADRPDLLPAVSTLQAMPYEVTVTIAWRQGIHQREVSLSVLRLAAATLGGEPR
jgi:general secretion pathway protein I